MIFHALSILLKNWHFHTRILFLWTSDYTANISTWDIRLFISSFPYFITTEGWGRFKPRLKNQSRNYFYIKLGIFELWNDHKLKSYKFKIWEKSSKMWILMKFQGSNRGPLECETNALPLHYFYAWAALQKNLCL